MKTNLQVKCSKYSQNKYGLLKALQLKAKRYNKQNTLKHMVCPISQCDSRDNVNTFEVFTAVKMLMMVFWVVKPRELVGRYILAPSSGLKMG
jgi:predicted PolB exonuclease-like 3'-5' exonuclease